MSKNQTGFKIEPADVWILEVTPSIQTQNGRFAYQILLLSISPSLDLFRPSGRDRIRTCDPALIKRML